MPLTAAPPHTFMASGGHHFRRQIAIQCVMPLSGGIRVERRQIIEAGQHFLSTAIGTGGTVEYPGRYRCLPGMSQLTPPPHFFIAVRRYCRRCQCTVFCHVPLRGKLGIEAAQVVEALLRLMPGADGAATATGTADDTGVPDVSVLAAPPYIASAAGQDLIRAQGAVPLWIPLGGKLRESGLQIVAAHRQPSPGAHRTARALYAAAYLRLPRVPMCALPPYGFMASRAYRFRNKGKILLMIPLGKQRQAGIGAVSRCR